MLNIFSHYRGTAASRVQLRTLTVAEDAHGRPYTCKSVSEGLVERTTLVERKRTIHKALLQSLVQRNEFPRTSSFRKQNDICPLLFPRNKFGRSRALLPLWPFEALYNSCGAKGEPAGARFLIRPYGTKTKIYKQQ